MKIPRSSRVVFSDLLDADPARKERVGSGLVGGTGPLGCWILQWMQKWLVGWPVI